jgi:hypothetical protein
MGERFKCRCEDPQFQNQVTFLELVCWNRRLRITFFRFNIFFITISGTIKCSNGLCKFWAPIGVHHDGRMCWPLFSEGRCIYYKFKDSATYLFDDHDLQLLPSLINMVRQDVSANYNASAVDGSTLEVVTYAFISQECEHHWNTTK